ncbi:hypothetical protein, partial [Escherichia coli]|uniref:hypothetical protein n=1 Tax=Escherichia coli TaxID=562 RepID=UPI00197F7361
MLGNSPKFISEIRHTLANVPLLEIHLIHSRQYHNLRPQKYSYQTISFGVVSSTQISAADVALLPSTNKKILGLLPLL